MKLYNEIEQEAVILNAVLGMIADMANYEIFVKSERTDDVSLLPSTVTHQRLFNVLLVDFLSYPQGRNGGLPFGLPAPPRNAKAEEKTYLFYLRRICGNPKLGSDVKLILSPVEAFSNWLKGEAVVEKVWFPSIDLETNLRVQRIEFLKICGNIAKHNFSRLNRDVSKIRQILGENGHAIDEGQGYSVLKEFYEWFHTDVLGYHLSTVAEFLNNIRWGIFEYIQPEFERSFERVDPAPMHRFRIPPDITQPLVQDMYWELMNMARSPPFVPRFTVTDWLKKRY
jgi:hypothetical protein